MVAVVPLLVVMLAAAVQGLALLPLQVGEQGRQTAAVVAVLVVFRVVAVMIHRPQAVLEALA